jgi:hypothetical protein
MGDGISVDLSALTTFAHNAGKLADDAQSDTKSLVQDITNNGRDALTGSARAMAASPGGVGLDGDPGYANFQESTAFARYHIVVAMSAAQFLNDVFMGTASLGAGAEFCAVNYANTDDFNARTLGNIQGSLKQGGLAGQDFVMSGGSVNLNGNQVNGAFAPKEGDGLFTTPAATPPPPRDSNKGRARDPREGDTKDPDPYDDFQKAIDKQTQEIQNGKVPDMPAHNQAPDSTDMPLPDDTKTPYQTGGGGVSV